MELSMSFERTGPLADEDNTLEQSADLDAFLKRVEASAFRIALVSVRNPDDALDIVQDTMMRLAVHYGRRPADQWKPLFYRILSNRIRDFGRRRSVSQRILSFFSGQDGDSSDPIVAAAAPDIDDPVAGIANDEAMAALERALLQLSERQREVFMLRNFESLDVAETATALGLSDGSVKTHHSRAVARLRELLGEHWS
jgi:RNA polymerase sigma-70 factor, ECF subfamily